MVEKGSELENSDKRKKYKYRVVFQGNNVVNESWETALFQNMGSSPATMEAGKICDMVGCYPDNDTEQADANQAYVQASLRGPDTWVWLPPEAWDEAPQHIKDKFGIKDYNDEWDWNENDISYMENEDTATSSTKYG